jgi:DNA-binding response OmpR family regulator
MELKILALGRKNVIRRVSYALTNSGISLTVANNISDAIQLMRKDKFDLALVDGYMEELETICYRITWQCRLPVVLIINGTEKDWNLLRNLDVDGFIPEEAGHTELVAYFSSIVKRKDARPNEANILIIEDDQPTLESLKLAFQIYWPETRVTSSTSGQDGLLAYRINPADLVILDLNLPDVNGFSVLEKIRSVSQVPVVILTASHNADFVIKAIKMGANDYILKPFKQLSLMSRIRQHLTMGEAVGKI